MGFWNTVTEIAAGVGAVSSLFGGDEPRGPNPRVATFSWMQQRVNAAEQIRQLGWQAWMADRTSELKFRQAGHILDTADVHDQSAALAGHNAAALNAKADMLGGVYDRERLARYGAANAVYSRTKAFVEADTKVAKAQANAAQASAASAITRANVAIERATIGFKRDMGALKLSQAQAGLRSSSFQQTEGAHMQKMLDLTITEQNAIKAAAGARAQAATASAQATIDRGAATLEFATGEHGRAMTRAADWFTQAESGRWDMRLDAMKWGIQAAAATGAAGRARTEAAGTVLAGIGDSIQADLFSRQAEIGEYFLAAQPDIGEYGGDERFLPGGAEGYSPPRSPPGATLGRGGSRTPVRTAPGGSEGNVRMATSRTPARRTAGVVGRGAVGGMGARL